MQLIFASLSELLNKIITRKSTIKIMAHRPYQAFFKKRLQTQSYLDTEMSTTYMSELTSKIISSLKNANHESAKKREKVQMTKSRIKTRENQQAQQREKIKTNIDSRMRISQSNLDKINSQRKKALSSRSQMQETRRKKFRQTQNSELQKSLVKMHQNQTETENFFRDTSMRKKEQFKRQQMIPKAQRTRYGSYNQTRYINYQYESENLKNSRTISSTSKSVKPIVHVLKVSDNQLLYKQNKKKQLQVQKQCRYLSEYMAKMENITAVRQKKGKKDIKQLKPTLPKVVSRQRQVVPRKSFSIQSSKHQDQSKTMKKKVSFSQMYMQKLSQKKHRKQIYHSLILQQGDEILQKQQQKTKVLKQSKIIKQSLNQYKRWSNMVASLKHDL